MNNWIYCIHIYEIRVPSNCRRTPISCRCLNCGPSTRARLFTYPHTTLFKRDNIGKGLQDTLGDVKSGFSDPADFATTRSPIDCELPKLFQESGSEQKYKKTTRTGIRIPIKYLFLQYIIVKIKFVYPMASQALFSTIFQNPTSNGPRKMWCYKVVAVRVKTCLRTLAAERLQVPRSEDPVFTSMGALRYGP
jgi:hypothetical protein